MRRLAVAPFAGLAPALGLGLGIMVVLLSPRRTAPMWWVWAPLAVALGALSGVFFVYGMRRWAELVKLHPVRAIDVAIPVVAIATFGVMGVNMTTLLRGTAHGYWSGGAPVVTFMTLATIPAASVAYGVRRIASGEMPSRKAGERIVLLIALRRLLQRLLTAGGGILALVTFQAGAAMALERGMTSPLGDRPPQYLLIFGGFGSLLVALIYIPAAAALQRRGLQLCDELFPISRQEEGSTILSAAENRQKLEQILGTDRSILADLQTGLPVLAPLVAGAIAAFLPQ